MRPWSNGFHLSPPGAPGADLRPRDNGDPGIDGYRWDDWGPGTQSACPVPLPHPAARTPQPTHPRTLQSLDGERSGRES